MMDEDFQQAVERYFDGDLDPVELRQLEATLESSAQMKDRFAAAYDARTATIGLVALSNMTPEMAECFSTATLERYAAGGLDPQDRATVEAHLSCSWCKSTLGQIQRDATGATRAEVVSFFRKATTSTLRVGALAAAAALVLFFMREAPPPIDPAASQSDELAQASPLDVRILPPLDGRSRGATPNGADDMVRTAHVGDRLRLFMRTGSAAHVELRVYLVGVRLELQCPGDQRCTQEDGGIEAELTLDSRGIYRVVRISSSSPLPESRGSVDADLERAGDVEVELRDIHVN